MSGPPAMRGKEGIKGLRESGRYPLLARVFDAPLDPDRLKRGFDPRLERVLEGLAQMLPE